MSGILLQLKMLDPARRIGYVRKVSQSHVEATGPLAAIGDLCEIELSPGGAGLRSLAEVVSVEDSRIILAPLDPAVAILPDARVTALPSRNLAPVGRNFSGRAVNALGEPIDGRPLPRDEAMLPLDGSVMPPMERLDADQILETGMRAIDGVLPIGSGQRIGVFAASGVGKTTLIRQLANQVACDRCVICLVGERGREVEGLWRDLSGLSDAARFTCVAATSDVSAALRVRAVNQAVCLAEHWRAQGDNVLLIVDSVTRLAMALRELGLAAGEPPTLRAYTPNVFSALPRLVERCGARKAGGSITAIVTVLSETDDVDDPIVELMKSLLDGHIILSRQLAEQGHFPAIDVTRSVSRQSMHLMTTEHAAAARRAVSLLATYDQARAMIESGIYQSGANARLDEAIRRRDGLMALHKQRSNERSPLADTLKQLQLAVG